MAAAKTRMSARQLRRSLVTWESRRDKAKKQRAFRYKKWHFYRYTSKRSVSERRKLRDHWYKSYKAADKRFIEAERNVKLRRKQLAAIAPKVSSREACVKHALGFVGVKEQPAGSNGGGIINSWERRLGFGHVAWCGIFAGNMLLDAGVHGVNSQIASVWAIYNMAGAGSSCFRGRTRDPRVVLPGDLVTLFGNDHVEMVVSIDLARRVVNTVGGNTSSSTYGSQSNGGCVARHARPFSVVTCFALVNFPG